MLILPSYLAKRSYGADIEDRLANMWRTHKNRVDRGLEGTYKEHGAHESLRRDWNIASPNAHWSVRQFIDGSLAPAYVDNVFQRWHESYEKYPSLLATVDDHSLYQTDDFERFKKFKAKDKDVVGVTPAIMKEDNDEKWELYDI